jgi:tetratricopeptide (TPR) repeat protein
LKEDFAKHQELLFNTAKRVAKLQGEEINDRIRRAMDALNEGLVREANTILNEAEVDAKNLLNEYKQSKEITEQKRQNLVISIEELSLKATSIMADASIPINKRIKQADEIYKLADTIAIEINLDEKKYLQLIIDYVDFSYIYGHYDVALEYAHQELDLQIKINGNEHQKTAFSYDYMGTLLRIKGNYTQSLDYYQKALDIFKKVLGENSPEVGGVYEDIGIVYNYICDYDSALHYFNKAMAIHTETYGSDSIEISSLYTNLGVLYNSLCDYKNALTYFICSSTFLDRSGNPKLSRKYL